MNKTVKGYKVFNSDWTCRDKQYSCPGTFEENVDLDVCCHGMHFCKKAIDCFYYYDFNPSNHVAEIIAYGNIKEKGDKCCTDKLEIVRELSWHEVLELVNIGKNCTGKGNTANWNSGNYNTGSQNSGNRNSGDWNSGDCNSGDWNSGNWNSGDCNSGDLNSGDWNKTNHSSGCFNTTEPKITFFNKESDWTYKDWFNSNARLLLNKIPTEILEWVWFDNMTEKEKEANPNAESTDGYLKVVKPEMSVQEWWDSLSSTNKNTILSIPNFDREIFKEITGIDVGEIKNHDSKKE